MTNDRLERLERLARLHADGLLTTSEFQREKKRLLEDQFGETHSADVPARRTVATVVVVAGLLLLLFGLAAWFAPRLIATRSKPDAVVTARAKGAPSPPPSTSVKAAGPATSRAPAAVAKPAPAPVTLRPLRDADSEQLDMGCMCAFSRGDEALLQISANTAVLRPQGRLLISRISDATFERMYGDRGQFTAGDYTVRVRPRASSEPGFDGHRTLATLTVSSGQERTEISGQWLCGC